MSMFGAPRIPPNPGTAWFLAVVEGDTECMILILSTGPL